MVLELGRGVSEPSVQRVLAERDADSGQVTVQQNPPDRTAKQEASGQTTS